MTPPEDLDVMDPGGSIAEVNAADDWFGAIASRRVGPTDELALGLVALLDRIDVDYAPPVVIGSPAVAPVVSIRGRRSHLRRLAAGTAAVATIGALGIGVAAATPGSSLYTVHRAIFGDSRELADGTTAARHALNSAETIVARGREAGGLTEPQRRAASMLVATAQDSLDGLRSTDEITSLRDRAAHDAAAIDALPSLLVVTTPVTAPTSGAAAPGDAGPTSKASATGSSGSSSGTGSSPGSGSVGQVAPGGSSTGGSSGSTGTSDGSHTSDHGSSGDHGSGSGTGSGSGSGSGSDHGSGGHSSGGGSGSGAGTGTGDSGGSGTGTGTGDGPTPTLTASPHI